MSGDLEPPDIRSDGDAVGSTSTLRSLSPAAGPGRRMSRSPHPYHRRGPRLTDADGSIPGGDLEETQYLPSPSPTPSPYDTELDGAAHEAADDTRRLKAARSSSDSGTEADDEGLSFLKGLPAPPTKPRKGLRDERGMEASGGPSPLLTPAYLSDSGRRYSAELRHHPTDATGVETLGGTEARKKVESLRKRRRSEVQRRALELLLVLLAVGIALGRDQVWRSLKDGSNEELLTHLSVVLVLFSLYPLQLWHYHARRQAKPARGPSTTRIRIPPTFDPAPLLYPLFLPVSVALLLLPANPKILLPNLVLSLATLPAPLIPGYLRLDSYNALHWLVTILPVVASSHEVAKPRFYVSEATHLGGPASKVDNCEDLVSLFPLHQALLPVLRHLATTSLLPTEFQLLSISLINTLLHAASPQIVILQALLWGGGISIIVLCGHVLRWGVALARIPNWRFRRAGHAIRASNAFAARTRASMVRSVTSGLKRAARARDSDADEDEDEDGAPRFNGLEGPERKPESFPSAVKDIVSRSAAEGGRPSDLSEPNGWAKGVSGTSASPQRRHTFSICNGPTSYTTERGSSKRRTTSSIRSYLTMTPQQANNRKWLYAGYVYTVIISIILVGIRPHVGKHALGGREPIGWAIGYMLGNVPSVRLSVVMWNLERWVSLPARASDGDRDSCRLGWVEHVRRDTLGEANTRLLICGYWLAVVAWGMAVVLRLSSVVEVDTRRKVFHGMMVAMLLPATFVDPTFAGFALILVLAIFLLLDLLRASQLPPLSRPLARFLTPYVDGRDLRGPVVVSHIFLLVGCAVPLWLCLAGLDRTGSGAWTGWDVTPRDVSMVSGVVCVGMGDAAASLLGRRYGRRKWPWGGGKSIEGSLAFALAVMVGLGGAKAWLRIGGWPGGNNGDAWTTTLGKVALASCGASLTEAVLTGGNDNVVVPVVLWVLVSGLAI